MRAECAAISCSTVCFCLCQTAQQLCVCACMRVRAHCSSAYLHIFIVYIKKYRTKRKDERRFEIIWWLVAYLSACILCHKEKSTLKEDSNLASSLSAIIMNKWIAPILPAQVMRGHPHSAGASRSLPALTRANSLWLKSRWVCSAPQCRLLS